MIIPLIYGTQQLTLGTEELFIKCSTCGKMAETDILISSLYYHFYHVPLFPFDKEYLIICNNCGTRKFAVHFKEAHPTEYRLVNKKYRHKFFEYAGVLILSSPLIFWLIYFIYAIFFETS